MQSTIKYVALFEFIHEYFSNTFREAFLLHCTLDSKVWKIPEAIHFGNKTNILLTSKVPLASTKNFQKTEWNV